jgi:hypothetical protein
VLHDLPDHRIIAKLAAVEEAVLQKSRTEQAEGFNRG